MRDEAAIQRAHDILHFCGTPEAPPIFSDPQAIHAAHDALAWVLGFPCGGALQENIDFAAAVLAEEGYVEIDAGRPIDPTRRKPAGNTEA